MYHITSHKERQRLVLEENITAQNVGNFAVIMKQLLSQTTPMVTLDLRKIDQHYNSLCAEAIVVIAKAHRTCIERFGEFNIETANPLFKQLMYYLDVNYIMQISGVPKPAEADSSA